MRIALFAVLFAACTSSTTGDRLSYVATQAFCSGSVPACPDKVAGDGCQREGDRCNRNCSVGGGLVCTLVVHECAEATPGNANPAGGCCSEWIACASGLTCQPVGPVYPGSSGVCVAAK
jgi:hypothetical protein